VLVKISKRNTQIYYITQFFHSLIFTIPIWVVFYQARITPAQIAFLITFQYASQMIMELPSGALADLLGRRVTILIGFLVGSLGYLLVPFASSFWHFLVLWFFIGMSDSFRSGSEEALLYDSFKQDKRETAYSKVYGNGNIIYQVGLITATFLGGLIFEYAQHLPFFLLGLSMVIGAIVTVFYIEPIIDSETFTLSNYKKQIIIGAKEAFKTTYSKYLSLFYIFVGGIGWSSTLFFNAYIMVDLGFPDALRGYLTAAMRLINVVLITKLLTNAKLFNRKRTLIFFPLIMLFGYLPGIWLNGFWGLPFVQAVMIISTARWIILSPLTNEVFSSKYRATAISSLSMLIGVVYISLTSISGFVISNYGVKTMYSLLGVISLVTVVPLTYKLLTTDKAQA